MTARYYITTPIYYATDQPHIGHAYTTVAADVAARYHRLKGEDVVFLTGTDEHGQKMEREAARQGMTPQALADANARNYAALWHKLRIEPTDFIRTTSERHRRGVLEMWRRMTAKGDIYRGEYEGRYCVSCESFYLDKELVEGRCPDHGTVPELTRESGYFFRLSAYQEPLLEHYRAQPGFIQPDSRRNEVVSFVRSGLRDLSVSRSTTRWGIPVPGDPDHVIYVWVDALSNYLSGVGFPDPNHESRWPADVHLVGKDILRFHAVYWPAFLLSAGLALPRQVFGHGWWLRDNAKISKSAGGAIRAEPLIDQFGADAVRYFLLREIPFGLDGSFSDQAVVQRYNADLANDFGNLVSRALQMIGRYRGSIVPGPQAPPPPEIGACLAALFTGERRYHEAFERLAFSLALEEVWSLVRAGNRFIDEKAPWVLARDPQKAAELDTVLWTAAELIRLLAACLSPVMPDKSAAVRASLGLPAAPWQAADLAWGGLPPGVTIGSVPPLFPRVDEAAWLAQAPRKENPVSTPESPVPPPAAPVPVAPLVTAPAAAPPAPVQLSIDEFMRLDLRVGRIKTAERVEKSKRLLRLVVDLGSEERQVVAGIAEKYAPEALLGKSVVVVANLKPAKLMGLESQGMVLAASVDGLPIVATFAEDVPPGAKVK